MANLIIRDIKSYQEIKYLVESSMDLYDDPYFIVDKGYAIKSFFTAWQHGSMLCVIELKGDIVAYGCANPATPSMHSKVKVLSQAYYHSILTGYLAVKALELFHDEMIRHASVNEIPLCVSSSILPNYKLFLRILKNKGWDIQGSTAFYRVPKVLPELALASRTLGHQVARLGH